jgi:hypothetical protein
MEVLDSDKLATRKNVLLYSVIYYKHSYDRKLMSLETVNAVACAINMSMIVECCL